VIGFVHNSDTNPDILLHLTQSLLELVSREGCRASLSEAGSRAREYEGIRYAC